MKRRIVLNKNTESEKFNIWETLGRNALLCAFFVGILVLFNLRITVTSEGTYPTREISSSWVKDSEVSEYSVSIYKDSAGMIRKVKIMETSEVTDNYYEHSYYIVDDPKSADASTNLTLDHPTIQDTLAKYKAAGGKL